LVASDYSLTIELPGFKQKKLASLTLNAFQNLALGMITLEVEGAPATTIDVTAEAPLIQTEKWYPCDCHSIRSSDRNARAGTQLVDAVENYPRRSPCLIIKASLARELDSTGYNDFRVNGKDGRQTR